MQARNKLTRMGNLTRFVMGTDAETKPVKRLAKQGAQ